MQAHMLSLNNFGMPKVYDGTNAAYVKLIQLILLDRGKFQSHPTMGVGLRSRYRFNNDENMLYDLKADITNQIERFLPELVGSDITLNLRNEVLGIAINTADGAYTLAYNRSTDIIDAPASYVLDNL